MTSIDVRTRKFHANRFITWSNLKSYEAKANSLPTDRTLIVQMRNSFAQPFAMRYRYCHRSDPPSPLQRGQERLAKGSPTHVLVLQTSDYPHTDQPGPGEPSAFCSGSPMHRPVPMPPRAWGGSHHHDASEQIIHREGVWACMSTCLERCHAPLHGIARGTRRAPNRSSARLGVGPISGHLQYCLWGRWGNRTPTKPSDGRISSKDIRKTTISSHSAWLETDDVWQDPTWKVLRRWF
jgi:hypothetical protein